MLCVTTQITQRQLAEQRAAGPTRMPASAPGLSTNELAVLDKLQRVSPEQWEEVQRLNDYCKSGEGLAYAAKQRKSPTRSYEYYDLALVDRPEHKRLPLLTTALSNPVVHDVEVVIWAEQDLREILESRDRLSFLQSWHARGWLLREVLGNSEQVELYWRIQCAWYGYCRSLDLLTEADRQVAEQVARRALSDLQRQDWARLIYRKSR